MEYAADGDGLCSVAVLSSLTLPAALGWLQFRVQGVHSPFRSRAQQPWEKRGALASRWKTAA